MTMKAILATIIAASLTVGCGMIEGEQTTTDSGGSTTDTGGSDTGGASTPVVSCNATFQNGWPQQFGSCSNDDGKDVAVDNSGNVYIVGTTSGEIDSHSNLGGSDVFVVKYDSLGNKQWSRQFGDSNSNSGKYVDLDSSGNIYVFGATGNVPFITKLNNAGTEEWTVNTPEATYGYSTGIAVDQTNGDIYITGMDYDTTFDGQTSNGNYDAYIVKYNNSGNKQWSRLYGGNLGDISYGIATDSSGGVYITGYKYVSVGNKQFYIAKYDTSGSFLWDSTFPSGEGNSISVGVYGNIYVTGETTGTIESDQSNAGGYDIFVAKYNSSGSRLWTEMIGGNKNDFPHSLETGLNEEVYITGYTFGDLQSYSSQHSGDVVTIKYNMNGYLQWVNQADSQAGGREEGNGIAVDQTGNVYITGQTSGGLDNNTNAGGNDVFVIKYDSSGNQL